MALLSVKNLRKSFNGVEVVSGVSIEVPAGKTLGLLGPSGCGKTTTLNMIAGLLRPDGGDIRLDGASLVEVPPHKRNMGLVFQNYALFPHMTVFDNVAYGLRMRRADPATQIAPRVRRALDIVRLDNLDRRYPQELSGGQQQRVALARALVIEPAVLLLDEPLSNLDARLREEMRHEIRQIITNLGLTTVFVTHDQEEALNISDIVVVMRGGVVEQIGEGQQLYQQPANAFVAKFLGACNVLEGTISATTGDTSTVDLGQGCFLRGDNHGANIATGERAVLLVRPERIKIVRQRPEGDISTAALRGRISTAAFGGAHFDYAVTVRGLSLRVKAINTGERFLPGEEIHILLRQEDCVIRPQH